MPRMVNNALGQGPIMKLSILLPVMLASHTTLSFALAVAGPITAG
jgi:hypothetical protein